jgi:hypothetical protein
MSHAITKSLLCVLAFYTLLLWPASGQGIFSGNVKDHVSYEALAGAHIFLEGSGKATVSDALGNFRFTNLDQGNYNVTITFVGYENLSAPVRIRRTQCRNLKLRWLREISRWMTLS